MKSFVIGDTVVNFDWCYKGFITKIVSSRFIDVSIFKNRHGAIFRSRAEGTKLTRLVLIEKTRGI